MKQYLLISNTTDYKINNNILNYLSTKLKDIRFQENSFKELSPKKAYEQKIKKEKKKLEIKNFTINII